MPTFTPNYPHHDKGALLPVAERVNASTDYTGRDVVIAYVDAGFYMHPDVHDRILVHVDATTSNIVEEAEVKHVDVTSWHGLMVSAIGSGNGQSSGGRYHGLAPESKLVLIKVSNPRMQVKEADIRRGFEWILKNHRRFNVRIVNVSVGGDIVNKYPDHPLHRGVREMTEAGLCVVLAAGNHGQPRLVPPASSPEGITVGGYKDHNTTNRAEWVGYHSNWGEARDGSLKPDILAPAEWIPSPILPETVVAKEARWLGGLIEDKDGQALKNLLKKGFKDLNIEQNKVKKPDDALYADLQHRIHAHKLINRHYQYVDGTSVAAPIVSALIAQMLEANPALEPEQIKTILKDTAERIPSIPVKQQGAGAINPRAALEAALRYRGDVSTE